MTFCQRILKIFFYLLHFRIIIDEHSVFKMQIQTPKVQVDTSHRCRIIIGYKYFCMYESRRVLIDLHTTLDQFLIIGLCHCKCIPFIRNMRHDDDHLDATLRRTGQCGKHLIIQDQIWCHDMHIFFCMV